MKKTTNTEKLMDRIFNLASGLMDLAWPNLCLLCDSPLINGEEHICMNCLYELPKTDFKSFQSNLAADRFLGKLSFEKVAAGYQYQKESKVQQALELLKYKKEKELGESLGRHIGARLHSEGFFEGIDLLVPVPLHKTRARERGYNQSEWIAKGLSKTCGIPLDSIHLHRAVKNSSQTTKSIWERWENTQGLFKVEQPGFFANKHILLVDDVLTSGSTLAACGKTILDSAESRISLFALALA